MISGHGVFCENEDGTFELNNAARLLLTGADGSLKDFVLGTADSGWWSAVGGLMHSVRTGEASFDHVHGTDYFSFLGEHPVFSQRFDRAMLNLTKREDVALVGLYDFSTFNSVLDVGGNRGALAKNLAQQFPQKICAVADLEHVVEHIQDMPDNMQAHICDFFQEVPAGYDCHILKRVLHDWDDEKSLAILNNCREALNEGGKLLVIDVFVPESSPVHRNKPHVAKDFDILMMTLLPGKERTEEQFRELLEQAGFHVTNVMETEFEISIIEAVVAS